MKLKRKLLILTMKKFCCKISTSKNEKKLKIISTKGLAIDLINKYSFLNVAKYFQNFQYYKII